MIQKTIEGNLRITISDNGFKIRQVQTGAIYDDAVDLVSSTYTYEETNEKIEVSVVEEPTE